MTGIAWRAVECYDLVSTLVIWRLLRDRFNRPAFSSSAPQFVSQFRTPVEGNIEFTPQTEPHQAKNSGRCREHALHLIRTPD